MKASRLDGAAGRAAGRADRVGVGEAPLRGRGGEGPRRLVELVAVAQAAAGTEGKETK